MPDAVGDAVAVGAEPRLPPPRILLESRPSPAPAPPGPRMRAPRPRPKSDPSTRSIPPRPEHLIIDPTILPGNPPGHQYHHETGSPARPELQFRRRRPVAQEISDRRGKIPRYPNGRDPSDQGKRFPGKPPHGAERGGGKTTVTITRSTQDIQCSVNLLRRHYKVDGALARILLSSVAGDDIGDEAFVAQGRCDFVGTLAAGFGPTRTRYILRPRTCADTVWP